MRHQIEFSQEEWELVLELLEAERRELPGEIHHTDRSDFQRQLRQRKKVLEELLGRMNAVPVAG